MSHRVDCRMHTLCVPKGGGYVCHVLGRQCYCRLRGQNLRKNVLIVDVFWSFWVAGVCFGVWRAAE